MYYVEPGATFEAVVELGVSGLVGTLELKIEDNQGATVVASSSAGIIESPANSGAYQATRTAPAGLGQYVLVWTDDGTYSANHVIVDDLTVVSPGASIPELPALVDDDTGAQMGPCNAWTTNDQVAACCATEASSDETPFDDFIAAASQALFELSARQWAGVCEQTVRPCQTQTPCGFQVLSRGHLVMDPYFWNGSDWGVACGCQPLSKVTLAGYPVREIVEVKIDGVALDPSEYTLKDHRNLIRMNGGTWPSCQRIDLPDTEEGTWSVTYTYGQNPPWLGMMAASELACELYKACASEELGLDCALPSGVTSLTRQGITIERNPFVAWGRQDRIWRTGLPHVDLFLNTYNPAGIRRRPVFVTPGRRSYPLSA